MERNEKALKLVKAWVKEVGKKTARKRLCDRGVGLATADKIVRNDYPSIPRDLLTAILLEEMAKDKIRLRDGKAS